MAQLDSPAPNSQYRHNIRVREQALAELTRKSQLIGVRVGFVHLKGKEPCDQKPVGKKPSWLEFVLINLPICILNKDKLNYE